MLSMSLNSALETLALGDGSGIHFLTSSKYISLDLISQLVSGAVIQTELSYVSLVRYTSLVKVALQGLANQFLSLVNETNLYCLVAVVLDGLNLSYYTGTSLQNGSTGFMKCSKAGGYLLPSGIWTTLRAL